MQVITLMLEIDHHGSGFRMAMLNLKKYIQLSKSSSDLPFSEVASKSRIKVSVKYLI